MAYFVSKIGCPQSGLTGFHLRLDQVDEYADILGRGRFIRTEPDSELAFRRDDQLDVRDAVPARQIVRSRTVQQRYRIHIQDVGKQFSQMREYFLPVQTKPPLYLQHSVTTCRAIPHRRGAGQSRVSGAARAVWAVRVIAQSARWVSHAPQRSPPEGKRIAGPAKVVLDSDSRPVISPSQRKPK